MRTQAPRGMTIVVAGILVVVGIAGTFLHLLPSVAGYPGATLGVVAYVVATVVMVAGVFIRGL
ncbi:MAG: hypothetical protein QFC55_01840 [Chloroflexota bacterium]|nr:hypothetical protein [Chloroflexota bacterium]